MGLIDSLQVSNVLIKFLKKSNKGGVNKVPEKLKEGGENPSGPGLESFFIAQSAFFISVREKGAIREELWKESKAVWFNKEGRLLSGFVGEGIPKRLW